MATGSVCNCRSQAAWENKLISKLIVNYPIEERGILVGVVLKGQEGLFSLEDSLEELASLSTTAGVTVVGRLSQRIDEPNPATYIGSGKLEELVSLVAELDADVVIMDDELSPRQQREIERAIGNEEVKVLDRTALILDIFAQHARTREGALQVELAQYEYRLPRLTRAWTHLARQAGGRAGGATGGVGVRGPGEQQIEIDRREIGRRIAFLRGELEEVRVHREQYRARRRTSHLPLVALVGYTNAGKSTLLNALSAADVLAANQLFATLDPTTRRLELPSARTALLTDTVGFIQKLPTQLVAAFRATLEEILEADLLLHVVDGSHANAREQAQTVNVVLDELGAGDIPILVALNKSDLAADAAYRVADSIYDRHMVDVVVTSALTGRGLDELAERIDSTLMNLMTPVEVLIPYEMGELVDLFHRHGIVNRQAHESTGTLLSGRLPRSLAGRYRDYTMSK
ncbi:MAG: GTPase HflX [Caldilineales bacterium]|nr:GTPase HflX [Caldilineales bacterium]